MRARFWPVVVFLVLASTVPAFAQNPQLETAFDAGAEFETGTDASTLSSEPGVPYWDLFNIVLDTLISDYWNADGNWDGDLMDDATSFAPEALLAWGYESGDDAIIGMGETTCQWELDLIDAGFSGDTDALEQAAFGALALWWGYRYNVDPAFDTYARLLPPIVNWIAIPVAQEMADDYWPASTLVGFMAHIDNEVARYKRHDERQRALDWAKDLIDWAYSEQFNPVSGLFDDDYLMSNGVMLTAVSEYARLSGDAVMLQRARDLFDALVEAMYDETRGGFWNEPGDDTKHLSKNLMAQRGVIALYEATGDAQYRELILDDIRWMKKDLFANGLLEHHWIEGVGRAGYVCTGCNFLFLDNMLHWRRAVQAHE